MNLVSVSTVNSGHSHTVTVPLSDLTSTTGRSYTSTATDHTHMVTLTAGQLSAINGGAAVTVTSSLNSGHTHAFTFQT